MKIIWMSDLHLTETDAAFPAGVDPFERARACFEDIRADHADADLLVITGDLIQLGNIGAYGILSQMLEEMPMPTRLLVGNHDDRQAFLAAFPTNRQNAGFAQSVEIIGGYRLVFLDTLAGNGLHHGELCADRLAWLEEALKGEQLPTLVFMHHPPFDVGAPALDALKLVDAKPLATIFEHSNVRQVFCGHLHRCVSGNWFGTPVSVIKSTHVPFKLDMVGEKLTRSNEPPGYGVIRIWDDSLVIHLRDLQTC